MLTKEQFDRNWREIKEGMRNLWGELPDQELESAKGNLYAVSDFIEKHYHESLREVRGKIDRLIESFDNKTDKGFDPDVSSYHRSP